MLELVASDQQRKFGQDKQDSLPRFCRSARCASPVTAAAKRPLHPHPDGEPGLNYLCAGYKLFFTISIGPCG